MLESVDELAPWKETSLVPASPVPVIVTTVPATPLEGLKLVTLGRTWKMSALTVDPPAFVTVIGPVTALVGTVAFSCVLPRTLKEAVAVGLPKVTLLVPVKVLPVRVTLAPLAPLRRLRPVIVGRTDSFRAALVPPGVDRKSTRLNSSHVEVSYGGFGLKKEKARTLEPSFKTLAPVR